MAWSSDHLTFSALSGTPLSRLRHRARWLDYLEQMLDMTSVRASARAVGLHRHTSFRWHHRFLALAKHERAGQTLDFITGRAAPSTRQLHRHLGPRLDRDVLLVTDAHPAYRAFAREAGSAHAFVNLRRGERVRGIVHVQNVNGYHQRLRQWLAGFHAVASRYLPNYLGWRWAQGGERIVTPQRLLAAALGVLHT